MILAEGQKLPSTPTNWESTRVTPKGVKVWAAYCLTPNFKIGDGFRYYNIRRSNDGEVSNPSHTRIIGGEYSTSRIANSVTICASTDDDICTYLCNPLTYKQRLISDILPFCPAFKFTD